MLDLKQYIKQPSLIILGFMKHCPIFFSDKFFVKLEYRLRLGSWPNLKSPQYFTEKLQWLKLHNRDPKYTIMVDKIKAKEHVAKIIGEKYIIPTLFIWDNADDIDFNLLPNQFVLKCNHTGGGSVFICKDKSHLNIEFVRKQLNKQLHLNTYLKTREWPYKNVERKILCEPYLEDIETGELRDYKFYCFDGVPQFFLIASKRFSAHHFNYYDMNAHNLNIESAVGKINNEVLVIPEQLESMKMICEKLSKEEKHIRVDLYYVNHKIYFGELTLYDSSGFDDFGSNYWNKKFGDLIKLSI